MGAERCGHLVRYHRRLPTRLSRRASEQVLRQEGDVLDAVSERGHLDAEDVDPIVEVFAEGPLLHVSCEVPVACCQESHVDLDELVAPHWTDLSLLQHSEELLLHSGAHIPDLIQEERPAI